MASGALTCWGYNADGELGDGTTKRRLMPVDVNGFTSGGIAVAAGAHHTCALTTDGGVRCWGLNDGGQIGDGTTMSRLTPVNVFATLSRNSVSAGEVACTQARYHRSAKTAFYRYRNVCHYPISTYVCAGTYDPFVETDPCRFEGDYRFHLRLDVDQTFDIEVPLPGGGLIEFNDMKECPKNRVIAGGKVNTFPCRHADPLMDVGAVTAGLDHTCVLTKSAGIKCWGANDFGQLGDGSKTTRPIAVDVAGLTAVAAVAAGENHTCAVTTAGGTLCWGSNSSGRLGDGSTKDRRTPIGVVGLGSGVEDVATGAISCALTVAGGVKCWGANANGELGNGSTKERHTPVAVRGF
jgi:alpha-tubulin suppressor-like RCC1 family protein